MNKHFAWRSAAAAGVVGLSVCTAQPASAITIDLVYRGPGQSIGGIATAGNAPPNAVGGGDLRALVDRAASYWEGIFRDPHTVTIEYGWAPLSSAGTHNLLAEGGAPHRETRGTVRFDNDGSIVWFLDPTPDSDDEFSYYTTYTADLGAGTMNVGREYSGASGSAARFDLLGTAIHEIGHSLGLASANNAFVAESADGDVDLSGAHYFGAAIPLDSGTAHVDLDHGLMRPSRPYGYRRYASDADILANAQVSGFTQIDFAAAIPEPAFAGLGAVAAVAVLMRRRLR
jgi:hypothetical protein